jgi:N-acetylneuraminic acid mutarotase
MRKNTWLALVAAVAMSLSAPGLSWAHFLWLSPAPGKPAVVELHFSEEAAEPEAKLLDRLTGIEAVWHKDSQTAEKLTAQRTDRAWEVKVGEPVGCVTTTRKWGVLDKNGPKLKNGERFKLMYYGKCLLGGEPSRWLTTPVAAQRLDLVPAWKDGQAGVVAYWDGQPLANAEVTVDPFTGESVKGMTSAEGRFEFPATTGLTSVRVKQVEASAGEEDGQKFSETRHYASLVFTQSEARVDRSQVLPELPFAVTSFGAAVIGETVYVAGGHLGESHEYNREDQSDELLALNTSAGVGGDQKWQVVAKMPRLQGLAMVAHRGQLYRVGGFEARNAPDEPQEMHSLASFARFDPATKMWTDLAPLPEGRSSLDAAVVGDELYVVGGWKMAGKDAKSVWHDTVWKANLTKAPIAWEAVPSPGFQRRAITAAAFQDKLYVIGGMSSDNKVTQAVSLFDSKTGAWSAGPSLPGETMEAFGASAFAQHGHLYVTGVKGRILRLSEDGTKWDEVGHLDKGRFFHRLLPLGEDRLVVVGGSSRSERILSLELVRVVGE